MKLATKFSISITILIMLTSSIVIYSSAKKEKETMLSQIKKKGVVLSEVLAMSSVNSLLNQDYETLRRYCDTIVKDPDVITVSILDNNLIIKMDNNIDRLGERANFSFKSARNTLEALNDNNKPFVYVNRISGNEYVYDIVNPIITASERLGFVRISLSSKSALLEAGKSNKRILLIGLLAITFGIIGAVFMAKRISNPINKLAVEAKAISGGDLNRKIDINSKDEVGVLANAFRYMTWSLKKHIESLIKAERFAILGRLASVVAHEVRNPMEPIKGSAKLLSTIYKDDMTIQKYTGIIQDEINRLAGFLDGFLEFARTHKYDFKRVNVNELVLDVLSLSEQYVRDRNFKIETELSENLPYINADSHQLKQVFMNLLLNAVQAKGDKKEGLLRIKTYHLDKISPGESRDGDEDRVVVEFLDFGVGIKKKNLERILEPFFTTKQEGTGLGLSTSLNIVEQHNGELTVESEEGEWTRIRIVLPTVDSDNSVGSSA